ncbi:hypothetical protein SteCoe_12720 [Stentor coeruleus]|uniref:Uncharacterized protein n=1 Tax=Stentor coeruleus TaxID=5963 RepID=A0A1R2CA43_9CILI|nr:hypothetical protein SteCoe_12720 [Stentor coeruleus]
MSYRSNSPSQDLTKLSPRLNCPKKLTILLSDCNKLQNSLVETWAKASKNSLTSKHIVKGLKQSLDNDPQNDLFRKEFENYRKKKPPKKEPKVSEVQKKIDSILRSPKINEKFPLKGSEYRNFPLESERLYINTDEIITKEARIILENNKRKFGEHFPKEIMLYENALMKKHKKFLPVLCKSREKIPDVLSIKPLRNVSGTVSQMALPAVTSRGLIDEEKDIFSTIFMENKRIIRKIPAYKYVMHKNKNL